MKINSLQKQILSLYLSTLLPLSLADICKLLIYRLYNNNRTYQYKAHHYVDKMNNPNQYHHLFRTYVPIIWRFTGNINWQFMYQPRA